MRFSIKIFQNNKTLVHIRTCNITDTIQIFKLLLNLYEGYEYQLTDMERLLIILSGALESNDLDILENYKE